MRNQSLAPLAWSGDILIFPPAIAQFGKIRALLDHLHKTIERHAYPSHALDGPVALYFETLPHAQQQCWPVPLQPLESEETCTEFLCRVLAAPLDQLQRCLTIEGSGQLTPTDRVRLFVGEQPYPCTIDGETEYVPGLCQMEKFIGMVQVETIDTHAPPPKQEAEVEWRLLGQLLTAFEGTSPEVWLSFPLEAIKDLLTETAEIRRLQQEAMDKDREDGSTSSGTTPSTSIAIQSKAAQSLPEFSQATTSGPVVPGMPMY